MCVLFSNIILFTVCVTCAYACVCVCEVNTCYWTSLWPVNYAERPQTWPACVVLWSSNERGASGRQARRAAEHTENDSSTAGSQTINRALRWELMTPGFTFVRNFPQTNSHHRHPHLVLVFCLASMLLLASFISAQHLFLLSLSPAQMVTDLGLYHSSLPPTGLLSLLLPFPSFHFTHFLHHLQSVQA